MTPSLNEIETMGKRAARGTALSWGLAEEAGKAARWLTDHGLPGPEALAELLTRLDGEPYQAFMPTLPDAIWQAPSGLLCPLICGAALNDQACNIASGHEVTLARTAHPLLLIPFAAGIVHLTGIAVALTWDNTTVFVTTYGLAIQGDRNALFAKDASSVVCRCGSVSSGDRMDLGSRREVDTRSWRVLERFAHRTFAPATETSRRTGAGAAETDND